MTTYASTLSDLDRIDAIDALADRLLQRAEFDHLPATEVWDIAAERVDRADWARFERDLALEKEGLL